MRGNKRKETRFARFSRRLLIVSFMMFVIGIVALNSYESSLNIQCQDLEKEIATIQSDIDGLEMKKQELVAFSRIESIAKKKGLDYKQSTMTAAVVGVQRD
ncbi:MAG: hypothetical protein ACLUVC_13875 [Longibaculum sp.]